jgi:hypothetical protein
VSETWGLLGHGVKTDGVIELFTNLYITVRYDSNDDTSIIIGQDVVGDVVLYSLRINIDSSKGKVDNLVYGFFRLVYLENVAVNSLFIFGLLHLFCFIIHI